MPKVTTFSIVVGGRRCNACCPFCISRMTGFEEVAEKRSEINIINFHKATRLAQLGGTTTVLLTGKGEPTLYPNEIDQYLALLSPYGFPFIEVQTNGLEIGRLARGDAPQPNGLTVEKLRQWHRAGLNTIALSTVGAHNEINSNIYHPDYPNLKRTVEFLHELGFTVRMCVMMMKTAVEHIDQVMYTVNWCKARKVEQLTFRSIHKPENATHNDRAAQYVDIHGLTTAEEKTILDQVVALGTPIMRLPFGATVLDVNGQNVCVTNCLTMSPETDEIRTLIFYSSGRLTYAWQYPGAILLGGNGED